MIASVAGIDFGGTATRFIILGPGGPVSTRTVATAELGAGSTEKRLSRLAETIQLLLPKGFELRAIGIGATGPVDRAKGIVHNIDTLPDFSGIPLVEDLHHRLDVPVVIDNDAVVAAVAEQQMGAGRGAARVLMVTLGTGIGAAMLIDGQPFRGSAGAHPEAGHIPISAGETACYCGATGCWEQLASRAALQVLLRPHLPKDVLDNDLLTTASAMLRNPAIVKVFDDYGALVGRGLSVLHTLFMPEVTVLGGSAAGCLGLFELGLRRSLGRTAGFSMNIEIRASTLGNEAGAMGAAFLAREVLTPR